MRVLHKYQSFEIRFFEWDFEREEYYYFPIPDTFAGKIYEEDAELTHPPKSTSMLAYELLFGGLLNHYNTSSKSLDAKCKMWMNYRKTSIF